MKRKKSDGPIQKLDSTLQTESKTRRKQNSGNWMQVDRNREGKSVRSADVPLSSIFKRLFQDVVYMPTDAVPPSNQGKLLTPCTPGNMSKCFKSVDSGTGQASHGSLQRSCITSLAYTSGIRKRPRMGLPDNTDKKSFMDRLDEDLNSDTFLEQMSGDESEEDGNAIATESDFEDIFDESFQPDFECSSQENTDSESEPEIEVVDLTVDTEPDTVLNTNRVKSLAALFEEAFRATEKPAKKALPKEDAYIDEGDATYTCTYCGAIMWFGERLNRRLKTKNPQFSLCCMKGQVQLPLLKQPPEVLKNLLNGDDKLSKHFQRNTRAYNMVFSFTSLGGKIDRSVRKGKGPNMLVLQGENYHLIGSLQPPNGNDAKFGQLYIVDTENEAENRTKALRSAKDRFTINPKDSFHMRIVSDRAKDGRTYDTPTASEVAALIPGDFNLDMDKRDIVLQQKSGKLLRIDEIHASYLALQYPLLFVHGEDGFRLGIKKGVTKATEKLKKKNISMRQFFAFRLHERKNEA
ncbi:unnamed protein product, partial [Brassica rapa subsp. narinosa]